MKKRINITIEKSLYLHIRRSGKNLSSYVSKLILNDIVNSEKKTTNAEAVDVLSSNLSCPINFLTVLSIQSTVLWTKM